MLAITLFEESVSELDSFLFMNRASRLLCGEKPTTILPLVHDHVLIQSVH